MEATYEIEIPADTLMTVKNVSLRHRAVTWLRAAAASSRLGSHFSVLQAVEVEPESAPARPPKAVPPWLFGTIGSLSTFILGVVILVGNSASDPGMSASALARIPPPISPPPRPPMPPPIVTCLTNLRIHDASNGQHFRVENVEKQNDARVWGGACTCPDGAIYQVGDNLDYLRLTQ